MVPHIGLDSSPTHRDGGGWSAMSPRGHQAAQLWFRHADADLGAPHGSPTISGFASPFQTYASMGHLLEHEEWPEDAGRGPSRTCAARWPTKPPGNPARRRPRSAATRPSFSSGTAGTSGRERSTRRKLPLGPPRDDGLAQGPARLDAQYWTANVDPSDRYVQSPPGSAVHRLRADEAGYQNLFLAGDWTNCGLNAGCIERPC